MFKTWHNTHQVQPPGDGTMQAVFLLPHPQRLLLKFTCVATTTQFTLMTFYAETVKVSSAVCLGKAAWLPCFPLGEAAGCNKSFLTSKV
jgi:hypothetical protein